MDELKAELIPLLRLLDVAAATDEVPPELLIALETLLSKIASVTDKE